jgi:segregation and condensation protein B
VSSLFSPLGRREDCLAPWGPRQSDELPLSFRRTDPHSARDRQFFVRLGAATVVAGAELVEIGPDGRRTRKAARVEAALFVSESAVSAKRLAQLVALADSGEAIRIIDQLNAAYDRDRSAFRIERAANGYRLLTRPDYSRWLGRIHQRPNEAKLSPTALETLTVVAYRQPITRADIEAIRGVHCTDILKQLMERGLVRIAGEDNSLGRPYLYETTRTFLELFGLQTLDDLPLADRLRLSAAAESEPQAGALRQSA